MQNPTRKLTTTLTDPRQMDAAIAQHIFGQHVEMRWCDRNPDPHNDLFESQHWYEARGLNAELQRYIDDGGLEQDICTSYLVGDQTLYDVVPHYSTDHNAAAAMRARIVMLGLDEEFAHLLAQRLGVSDDDDDEAIGWCVWRSGLFSMVDADLVQQCRAALAAVGVATPTSAAAS